MDSWHDEMQQEASKPKVVKMRSSRLRYWAAAACIVLVAGLSYLFLLSGGNTSAEELYADNFKPYQDLITMRDGSADAQIATAMETYRAGNFEDAVPLFDALMDSGHETAGLLLYSGIAHIAQPTPQTEEGIGHVEWIIANYKDSEYYFAAEWYLGLAYLQLPDSEKAKKQFEKISLLGNSYSAKADEILENL